MNLYKILARCLAPKSSYNFEDGYVLAENESDLYDKLVDKTYWNEKSFDEILDYLPKKNQVKKFLNLDEYYEFTEEDEKIILELWKQYVISTKGEIGSDWANYEDLFYGDIHYGWELVKENLNEEEIKILTNLKIV